MRGQKYWNALLIRNVRLDKTIDRVDVGTVHHHEPISKILNRKKKLVMQ